MTDGTNWEQLINSKSANIIKGMTNKALDNVMEGQLAYFLSANDQVKLASLEANGAEHFDPYWDRRGAAICFVEAFAFEELSQQVEHLKELAANDVERAEVQHFSRVSTEIQSEFSSKVARLINEVRADGPDTMDRVLETSVAQLFHDWSLPMPLGFRLYFLGRIAYKLAKIEDEAKYYGGLASMYPKHTNYVLLLISSLRKLGRNTEALDRLQILGPTQDYRVAVNRALILRSLGSINRNNEALALAVKSIEDSRVQQDTTRKYPSFLDLAYLIAGEIYISWRRFPEAIKVFQEAQERGRDRVLFRVEEALTLILWGKRDFAKAALLELLAEPYAEVTRALVWAQVGLGDIALRERHLQEALHAYEEALRKIHSYAEAGRRAHFHELGDRLVAKMSIIREAIALEGRTVPNLAARMGRSVATARNFASDFVRSNQFMDRTEIGNEVPVQFL